MVNLRKEQLLRFVAGNGTVDSVGATRVPLHLLSATRESQTSCCQSHPESLQWLGSHSLCRKHRYLYFSWSQNSQTWHLKSENSRWKNKNRTKENSRWKPRLNSAVILGGAMFRCSGFVYWAMTDGSSRDNNTGI